MLINLKVKETFYWCEITMHLTHVKLIVQIYNTTQAQIAQAKSKSGAVIRSACLPTAFARVV